eukprot:6272888-Prymnesium_polylepis.1
MELPHEASSNPQEEDAEMSNPQELVDKAKALKDSAEELNLLLFDLQVWPKVAAIAMFVRETLVCALPLTQGAQMASKAHLNRLKNLLAGDPTTASAKGVSWARSCDAISKRIDGFAAQSSQMLASVQEGQLQTLRSGSLESFRAQSEAFKSARQKHETAQSNLTKESEKKSGGAKKKKMALQKEVDATRKTQEETAKAAAAGAIAAETEHMRTTRHCIRDIAFSQARGPAARGAHPRGRATSRANRRPRLPVGVSRQCRAHAVVSRVPWRCTRAGWRSSRSLCPRSHCPSRPRRRHRNAPPAAVGRRHADVVLASPHRYRTVVRPSRYACMTDEDEVKDSARKDGRPDRCVPRHQSGWGCCIVGRADATGDTDRDVVQP